MTSIKNIFSVWCDRVIQNVPETSERGNISINHMGLNIQPANIHLDEKKKQTLYWNATGSAGYEQFPIFLCFWWRFFFACSLNELLGKKLLQKGPTAGIHQWKGQSFVVLQTNVLNW